MTSLEHRRDRLRGPWPARLRTRAGALPLALLADALRRRQQVARLHSKMSEVYDRAREAEKELRLMKQEHQNQAAEIRKLTRQLVVSRRRESPVCGKVPFHYQPEAWKWLKRVARSRGESQRAYEVYACPVCPPNAATGDRFWHVRHSKHPERELSTSPPEGQPG